MSSNWTTQEVMQCLEGMGVSVSLVVEGRHRYNAGAQLEWHHKEFIDKHYFKIHEALVNERLKRKTANQKPEPFTFIA